MNIYSKTVPNLGTKVIGNAEECIALLDAHKPLPYDEVIAYFIKMSRLGNSDIDKLSKISLQLYSNYLMKRHVIYPIKEDVINFIFQNRKMDFFEIDMLYFTASYFTKYVQRNFGSLFGGIFAGRHIERNIDFTDESLIQQEHINYSYGMPEK